MSQSLRKWHIERGKIDRRLYLHFSRDTFIHTENEWRQFLNRDGFNWISFHVFLLHIERDYVAPGWELEFRMLGIGFRIRHTFRREWDESELGQTVREARHSTSD